MAKKAKINEKTKSPSFELVNPNAAGIDVSSTEMQVCVPRDRCENNNRKFGVYTDDLIQIADWLIECGIETVAMESTGVYWLGLYKKLNEYGLDVILGDATSVKNTFTRKTDENDAEWIMLLHAHGLIRPCHQLDNEERSIRNLYRHRQSLIEDSAQVLNRVHKALTQMNIKLDVAISDIAGKSGIAIITAIIKGERDPNVLASYADWRCKKSKEEIAKSLTGTWDEDLLFVLAQNYAIYENYLKAIKECDVQIETMASALAIRIENINGQKEEKEVKRSNKAIRGHNRIGFDAEDICTRIWGVNPMMIPGFSTATVFGLLAELGPNFVDEFESDAQFSAWANLAPNTRISGGKILSCKVPRKYNPVGQLFRMAASSLYRSKDPLGNYYRRMKSKGGAKYANVATAHKMAIVFYNMVKNKTEYDASKIGPTEEEIIRRKIKRLEKDLHRLNQALEKEAS